MTFEFTNREFTIGEFILFQKGCTGDYESMVSLMAARCTSHTRAQIEALPMSDMNGLIETLGESLKEVSAVYELARLMKRSE